ncbi:MAG: Re/Si-specific NAD(P)(+) transhydrogenase subunit alpha [Alphaproteobacteria bacterium]|jgi:NAD(P) transhydrogenase subunit alpha
MKIAVPKEVRHGEARVAASPDTIKKMKAWGAEISIQTEAGLLSDIPDTAFENAGAAVRRDFRETIENADIILKIQRPTDDEIKQMDARSVLVCLMNAKTDSETLKKVAEAGLTCFAMELLPRISRAQSMDVLSSQSNLAGYKAVIDAAAVYRRALPMMMTAAGTVAPAHILVLGAGVAGLQAIATAKRLGAVVSAFDVRPAVREQVESLGAKFVEVEGLAAAETVGGYAGEMDAESRKRQEKAIADAVVKTDIIITTALIPGKKAPILVTGEMLKTMKPGSVILDLAADQGGNCEGTVSGESVERHGVTILGYADEASRLAADASLLFAKNLYNFITPMINRENGTLGINFEDEIYKATCVARDGSVLI